MAAHPNLESSDAKIIGEYADAVGLLTIYWAALENALLLVIEGLLQTDEMTTRCIGTSIEKCAARAALIQRLAYRPGEKPSQEWADCISGLCSQISNVLGPERNRLIHDGWHPNEAAMTRTNMAVKIGKPSSRAAKSLLQTEAAPSHVSDIVVLTGKVVDAMFHIVMQGHFFKQWKQTGQIPRIPEQAIQLSKGLPVTDAQSDDPKSPQPPQS